MTNEPVRGKRIEESYSRFRALLDAEDKEGCVRFSLSTLESGELDVVSLYEGVLGPAAREQECSLRTRELCVWEEHVRTSIIRTVVECCYPHLMRSRRGQSGDKTKGQAVIVCPTEEYHELGARMAADLLTLSGFETTFVGANTPQHDILEAVALLQPVLVGVGVTGPYNLIAARRVLLQLVELRKTSGGTFRIIAGGQAFGNDVALARSFGADLLVQTYDEIRRVAEEVPWASR
ncbi:MAG: cobalamin B12-binding domain-containing protein [Dehalococcoidia bacterium]|nr:cobalamin B12-binding domain-containing protein [Dehalococcoidia bacterium]